MAKSALPNLPSELITLALKDLVSCEADPDYEIDMTGWHTPWTESSESDDSVCLVCFAGAVIAKTFDSSPKEDYDHMDFGDINRPKLIALDHFRQGFIDEGLDLFGYEKPIYVGLGLDRGICRYDKSPARFRSDMILLAKDLADIGF